MMISWKVSSEGTEWKGPFTQGIIYTKPRVNLWYYKNSIRIETIPLVAELVSVPSDGDSSVARKFSRTFGCTTLAEAVEIAKGKSSAWEEETREHATWHNDGVEMIKHQDGSRYYKSNWTTCKNRDTFPVENGIGLYREVLVIHQGEKLLQELESVAFSIKKG